MKKILLSSLASVYLLANNVGVSILPQVEIVKKLLPNANITTLMPAGADPHTYEPKPKQMMELSKAKVFLGIGVEIEDIWLKRLAENTNIKIIHTDENIQKNNYSHKELNEHHHEDKEEHHHHEHHHEHSGLDVHIWTDPILLKQIAQNSANALKEAFPNESKTIDENLKNYEKELDELNLKIYDLTKNVNVKGFISAHPSWGYFAKRYNLVEYTLEFEGKEIKPSELAKIIEIAKDKKACLVLKAPQFNDKLAKTIHKESGLKLVEINQLSNELSKELLNFAKIINDNCSKH